MRSPAAMLVLLSACSRLVDTGPYVDHGRGGPVRDAGHDGGMPSEREPDAFVPLPDAGQDGGSPTQSASGRIAVVGEALSADLIIAQGDRPLLFAHGRANASDANELFMLDCQDAACSKVARHPVATVGPGDPHPRIMLGRRGRIWIAYRDVTRGTVVVRNCDDARCTQSTPWVVAEGLGGDPSLDHALSLDRSVDEYPLLAYHDVARNEVHAVACQRMDCCQDTSDPCAEGGERNIFLKQEGGGAGVAVALGQSFLPALAYRADAGLTFLLCTTLGCPPLEPDAGLADRVVHTLDGRIDLGDSIALLHDADGLPNVFYAAGPHVRLVHCNDGTCASRAASEVLDGDETVATGDRVVAHLDPNARALIAYRDRAHRAIKLIYFPEGLQRQGGAPLPAAIVTLVAGPSRDGTGHLSFAFTERTHLPVVAYRNDETGHYELAFCRSEGCLP